MPPAKTEVALQFSECCAAETALQHWLFCSAEVICTKSCAAANEKLHCNIAIAALQESGAFLPLSCGFQAPTFMHPRLGPAEDLAGSKVRVNSLGRSASKMKQATKQHITLRGPARILFISRDACPDNPYPLN